MDLDEFVDFSVLLLALLSCIVQVKPTDHEVAEASCEEVAPRQMIEAKLQEIVEGINESRKVHTETMLKFKKELDKKVSIDNV